MIADSALSTRARNALLKAGFSRIAELEVTDLGRLGGIRGIGARTLAEIQSIHDQLVAFAGYRERLRDWSRQECRRLAADFDPLADIPLADWQEQWPPGRRASADAFSRLLGRELPLRPPK